MMVAASRRLLVVVLLAVTGTSGALAVEPLILARDGRALATIVAPQNNTVPGIAARELKSYLDRITGAQFQIAASADTSPRIFVGDCTQAKSAGLDVAKLKRDGYFRGVVGEDLYLLGRDAPGPVKLMTGTCFDRGSLFAVYDFLEDVCGVRFIKAGPHGEVVPPAATLTGSVCNGLLLVEVEMIDAAL